MKLGILLIEQQIQRLWAWNIQMLLFFFLAVFKLAAVVPQDKCTGTLFYSLNWKLTRAVGHALIQPGCGQFSRFPLFVSSCDPPHWLGAQIAASALCRWPWQRLGVGKRWHQQRDAGKVCSPETGFLHFQHASYVCRLASVRLKRCYGKSPI